MSAPPVDIEKLSHEEQLRLLEQLWESLVKSPQEIHLADGRREELDRRLDNLDRQGPVGIPWEEVLSRVLSRSR